MRSEMPMGSGEAMAEMALQNVSLYLPSYSGLAHFVWLEPSTRIATAGVFESGRIVYNPKFFASLKLREAIFIMAHELMHLALQTHARGIGRNRRFVNIAHDYVINDMLRDELGIDPPAGGLVLDGARDRSLEELTSWLEREKAKPQRWQIRVSADSALGKALARAGLSKNSSDDDVEDPYDGDDVLDITIEREWFPGLKPGEQSRRIGSVLKLAAEAAARREAWAVVGGSRQDSGEEEMEVAVLRAAYQTPWQQALQRWFECHAPGNRSFSRPSRRGADRSDVVLPGRIREGWTIHIVLDTSGSMSQQFPALLGALSSFAASAGVGLVRVLQCDTAVTSDEWVEVENLESFKIAGLGGSDMSPAMDELARDSEVQAVLVLTDGCIHYPEGAPPYDVLWVLTEANQGFQPGYGERIVFERPGM